MRSIIILLLFTLGTSLLAQPSHSFTSVLGLHPNAFACGIAVGQNGTVFVALNDARDWGGVSAYNFDGSTFSRGPYIDGLSVKNGVVTGSEGVICYYYSSTIQVYHYDGYQFVQTGEIEGRDPVISTDGTIYAELDGVLSAYIYDGASYTSVASISANGGAELGPDGTILVVRNDSLIAYQFSGSSFTPSASINVSPNHCVTGPDGIVYLGDGDILTAYSYNGSHFTLIDTVGMGDWGTTGGLASWVAGPGGTVFLARSHYGVIAFSFDDTSFTDSTSITVEFASGGSESYLDLAIGPDGTLYSASGGWSMGGGLVHAFSFDGTALSNIGITSTVGLWVTDVSVCPDGTIYVAGNDLKAYTPDGVFLTKTAQIHDGGYARRVAIGPAETVFLASEGDGLRAYSYDGVSFTGIAHMEEGGSAESMVVTADSIIILADGDDGLKAYAYNGSTFINTAEIDNGGYAGAVTLGNDGTVFLANGDDGLRAYTYTGSTFTNTANINNGGYAADVTVGNDGTIFLANGDDGLRAYSYNGTSFLNMAHIDDLDSIKSVTVGPDGTLFVLMMNSLIAYSFDGSTFTATAVGDGIWGGDVKIDQAGTVYIAKRFRGFGLEAYVYSGYVGVQDDQPIVVKEYTLAQNFPNPFNPSTTISYELPTASDVALSIYDIRGRAITTLRNEHQPAGTYSVLWNGQDDDGLQVGTGLYFCRLEAGGCSKTIKMVYLK